MQRHQNGDSRAGKLVFQPKSLLKSIDENNVSIEYMYGLSVESDKAYVVLKASDTQKIDEILAKNGVATLSCKELANL